MKRIRTRFSSGGSVPEIHSDHERLRQVLADRPVTKLHVGCGPRILKGWINIDLAFEPFERYLQYYGDEFYSEEVRGGRSDFFALDVTREGIPFDDNTVDVIFHEDFIEHLDQRGQILFLAETLRVLKPGGVHRVNTPDLTESMRRHSTFSRGAVGVYIDEWDRHGHKSVLTSAMLTEMAMMVGYRDLRLTKRDSSASDLLPNEYRPDPRDREEWGNIFADLMK
ncbi:MAG: methyltransferase domain-containing protein [Nitrospira sp.]|nr:methyltransferase domain-containing protein [Nitrospira sp.]